MPRKPPVKGHRRPKGKFRISSLLLWLLLASCVCYFVLVTKGTSSILRSQDKENKSGRWKISAVIPSCNRLHSLQDAITSVLQQSYPIHEVIVACDSGQKCIPATKLKNIWNDKRVRYLQVPSDYKGQPGPGRARKYAIENANPLATHYAMLDDDDEWFPEKTMVQVSQMQAQNYSFSSSDAAFPKEGRCKTGDWTSHNLFADRPSFQKWNGGKWYNVMKQKFKLKDGESLPTHVTLKTLQIHNIFVTSSVIVAKEYYLGFDENASIGEEDYHLWLKILEKTNALFINNPLILYDNRRNECDDASTSKLLMA